MNYSIAGIFLILGLVLFCKHQSSSFNPASLKDCLFYYTTNFKDEIKEIENSYDIKINYHVNNNFVLPPWNKPPFNGKATQISDFELCRFVRLLPGLLARYPASVISENINGIALCEALEFYEVEYGGTSLAKTLYLTSKGRRMGFTDMYLRELFHHEMSSLLMSQFPFDYRKWSESNPADFQYKKTTAERLNAIKHDRDGAGEARGYREGFLSRYSQSSLENDFNVYAENIFVYPGKMENLIAQYPNIKAKYLLVKEFYLSIHPGFLPVFQNVD
ncbi:MAG: hypothetical protein GY737_04725 [Desulfobacteraceae bacterium]|nr:hypothetical protein [Desulfobacteraceae bacterium]